MKMNEVFAFTSHGLMVLLKRVDAGVVMAAALHAALLEVTSKDTETQILSALQKWEEATNQKASD